MREEEADLLAWSSVKVFLFMNGGLPNTILDS